MNKTEGPKFVPMK